MPIEESVELGELDGDLEESELEESEELEELEWISWWKPARGFGEMWIALIR